MASYDSYQGDSYRGSGFGGGSQFGGSRSGGSQFGGGGFTQTPPVVRGLIFVNVGVFFVQLMVGKFTTFDYMRVFALNTDKAIGELWLWQFVTSTFMHSPDMIMHIVFNMFALWVFGRDVERRLGSKRFLTFYLLAGAFASMTFAIVGILGAQFGLAVGASGSVLGVLVVYACLFPDAMLLAFLVIPVKAKHLVMFIIAIDLTMFVFMSDSSQTAHSAHLGGALFGYLYMRLGPRFQAYLHSLEAKEQARKRSTERETRARVDGLLDKIAAGEQITAKERKFLGEASKKYYGKKDS